MILPLDEENLSKEKPDPKVEQKRWKCDSCSQSFTQSGSLNKHIYTVHGGHKDFKCQFCGKSFLRADC